MIILDTNVVSELMSGPQHAVGQWLRSVSPSEIYTTTITRAEIGYVLARLPEGRRRADVGNRAAAVFDRFAERWLPFDTASADIFRRLVAERESIGRPISAPDAQIASIARYHRATVATRNVADFDNCGLRVVNPFDA